ncbi:MAG: cell division protein FtsA, partial [Clostridiaceae bacterium]
SGIKNGVVIDIENTSKSISVCINQLERMIDKEISEIYLSVSDKDSLKIKNKGVVSISSNDMEIATNDVNRVLNAAKVLSIPSDKEIIDIIPIQYIIDGYDNIKDPVGMRGTRIEVEADLILANSTLIDNIIKSVNKTSLKVVGIILNSNAMLNVLTNEEKKLGSCVIDVGFQSTDVYIYKNSQLKKYKRIPLGGNNITNDISICLKISYNEAEKLKLKYGCLNMNDINKEKIMLRTDNYLDDIEVDLDMLNQVIEARVEEICLFIKEILVQSDFYEDITELVLVGGGVANIKNIENYFLNIFNKPVRINSPKYVGAANPIFSLAIGIIEYYKDKIIFNDVDRGIDENENTMNKIKRFFRNLI